MRPHSSVVLPVECLQEIISHCHDSATLFSLLTVSKAVCGIAARRLYADPFAMVHERQHSSGSKANKADKGKKGLQGAAMASPVFSLIQRVLEDTPANDPLTNCLRAACYPKESDDDSLSPLLASPPASPGSPASPNVLASIAAQSDLQPQPQEDSPDETEPTKPSAASSGEHQKKRLRSKKGSKPWKQARKPGSSSPFLDYLSFIRHVSCSYSMLEDLGAAESLRLCMPILNHPIDITGSSEASPPSPVVIAINHTTGSTNNNTTTSTMTSVTSLGSSASTSISSNSNHAVHGSSEHGSHHHNPVSTPVRLVHDEEEEEDEETQTGAGGDQDDQEDDIEDEENNVMSTRYRLGKDKAHGRLLEHLAWAICAHQPQQIKTLHLPTEHLVRFKCLLPKMTSLETVVIDIKRALLEGEMPERRLRILDFAKDFVALCGEQRQVAVDLDNGLRPVSICTACAASESPYSPLQRISRATTTNNNTNSPSLKMLLKQIREILPPLNCPRSLTLANWAQFRTKAASTNLAHVRTLEYETRQSPSEQASPFDPDGLTWEGSQGDLLKRCRSLRSLKLFVWERDAFQWAVEEKLRLQRQQSSSSNASLDLLSSSSLLKLQWAKLNCEADMVRDVMDDFLFAFGHSLQSVNISLSYNSSWSDSHRQGGGGLLQENHAIGQRWRLQSLTHLSILSRSPLLLASSAFSNCHNLVNMVLYDTLEIVDPSEVIWQEVWHMPKLVRLKLVGAPAVAFHPASLASMGKLKSIVLEGPRVTKALEQELLASSVQSRTPADKEDVQGEDDEAGTDKGETVVEERERRVRKSSRQGRWAWREWSLPSLEEMSFRGWPAHGFDLSVFHQCPRLQDVLMDCRGYDGHREIDPPWLTDSKEEEEGTDGQASTSASCHSRACSDLATISTRLARFRLVGPWILSNTTMQQLLTGVHKQLEYLYLSDCQQYTIEELVQYSKPMPRLGYIYCSRSILPEEAQRLGLAPPKDVSTIMPFPGERKDTQQRQSSSDGHEGSSSGDHEQVDEEDGPMADYCDYCFNGKYYRHERALQPST